MRDSIRIHENGFTIELQIAEDDKVHVVHFGLSTTYDTIKKTECYIENAKLVEVRTTGLGCINHNGSRHNYTGVGELLRYVDYTDTRNTWGRKVTVCQKAQGLVVTSHLQFYDGVKTIRCWTCVENQSEQPVGLEYVSSLVLPGIAVTDAQGAWDQKSFVSIPHNTWYGEAQWYENSVQELGLARVNDFRTYKGIVCSSVGSWSCGTYLPMGSFRNTQTRETFLWQIENNGSWCWEIGDCMDGLALQLSGPCEDVSHWWKNLKPGECFVSVPAALSLVQGDFDQAVGEMTRYRRIIRRPNEDNETLPVIFNDYMNCLMGDPTTEKLLPLIDAAAQAGCEYFCIDAGWYADGFWLDSAGEWLPSAKRFPNGIQEPLNRIREKGMRAGLWLEIETIGINCPLIDRLPEDWFFQRHGKRVNDQGRYQLDFRNPQVCAHADAILARLVEEYGAEYIKMDYNMDAGIGTDWDADSAGDGLLEHNRAYLNWLDGIFERYPHLIIENCGSGGMRQDYALLSRHSIQSSSDQTDYIKNGVIAGSSAAGICPEQCAVWSYPMRDSTPEQVAYNMVNALLLRIHQSGHPAELSQEGYELVCEGIQCYKQLRNDIKTGLPFWPLGMPHYANQWNAYGLRCGDKSYLAIWRLNGSENLELSLKLEQKFNEVKCIYPVQLPQTCYLDRAQQKLSIEFPQTYCARLYQLS